MQKKAFFRKIGGGNGVILIAALLCGAVSGAFCPPKNLPLAAAFLAECAQGTAAWSAVSAAFGLLVAVCICATSPLGLFAVPLLVWGRGFACGSLCALAISLYGIGRGSLMVLVQTASAMLWAPSLLLIGSRAMKLSAYPAGCLIQHRRPDPQFRRELRCCVMKIGLGAFGLLGGGIAAAFLTPCAVRFLIG